MKLFYIAINHDGKKVKGFIEAADKNKAAFYLRDHALMPLRIEQPNVSHLLTLAQGFNNISEKDLIFFTRQLSSLLASGLTLQQALGILMDQVQKSGLLAMLQTLISNVEEGKAFSESIALYPKVFSPVYISLIKAGETTGVLDKVMLRLADTLEKRAKLKAQIRSALLYPAIVLGLMLIVIGIMMVVVIPQLSTLYESLNVSLPFTTQIVIGLSNFTVRYIVFIIIASVIFGYYFNHWRKTEKGKLIIDSITLRIPIVSKLISESTMAEFSRTFGMLVGTGALVIESLKKSASVLNNSIYKQAITSVAENVEKGFSIGDAMSRNAIFPPFLIEMVKVGEQTGKLDESLTRVSEYFEREVDQTVKVLTTALEPAIMVVLAVGVGFLVISVITPIYQLISAI